MMLNVSGGLAVVLHGWSAVKHMQKCAVHATAKVLQA